jgi:hypothetical protein
MQVDRSKHVARLSNKQQMPVIPSDRVFEKWQEHGLSIFIDEMHGSLSAECLMPDGGPTISTIRTVPATKDLLVSGRTTNLTNTGK